MKKFGSLAIFTCLVLGFQNCSQSNLGTSGVSSSAIGDSASESTLDGAELAQVSSVEIPYSTSSIPENTSGEGIRAARKASAVTSEHLVIALDSGAITLVNSNGQAVAQTCLDESRLEEMKSYLASASICEAEVAEDVACSQQYEQGYASLKSSEGQLNLGESLDGCGRGYKDFCGSMASSFKGLVESIKLNWQSMSCN
jgi:hypothetical protein